MLNDNGSNFHDWYQRLRSVLKLERKLYVIDEPIPILSRDNATKISVEHTRVIWIILRMLALLFWVPWVEIS